MSGSRPFVHVDTVVRNTGVPKDTWMQWLLDERECSVMFLRSQEGTFVEASSLEGIVRRKCTPEICAGWMRFCRANSTQRRLTDAEKKRVAAEQKWTCAGCGAALDATYEVDHIEQHAIRANNARGEPPSTVPGLPQVQDGGGPVFWGPAVRKSRSTTSRGSCRGATGICSPNIFCNSFIIRINSFVIQKKICEKICKQEKTKKKQKKKMKKNCNALPENVRQMCNACSRKAS